MSLFWNTLMASLVAFLCGFADTVRAADPTQILTAHAASAMTVPGLSNVFALASSVYSGSSPETEEAFAGLEKLGIRTIISVDGTLPDVETARRHGLGYVHLPFGYDGVPQTNAWRLIKAVRLLPGPFYVHCHHGQHRGPAAAAIICEGTQEWSASQAVDWLRLAQTGTNYTGLYQSVATFQSPRAEQLGSVPDQFPSQARTPRLVSTMVQIDQHTDHLKSMARAGFAPAPGSVTTPASEALMVAELFHESGRAGLGSRRGEAFVHALGEAEAAANEFYRALTVLASDSSPASRAVAQAGWQKMTTACQSCHRTYRDPAQ